MACGMFLFYLKVLENDHSYTRFSFYTFKVVTAKQYKQASYIRRCQPKRKKQ